MIFESNRLKVCSLPAECDPIGPQFRVEALRKLGAVGELAQAEEDEVGDGVKWRG